MAKNSPALASFNAGELSPDVAARVDNQKYAVGCSQLSNFIPRVQGPARRRPGTRYVATSKGRGQVLLRKFVFSEGDAAVIEFGNNYCRFYTNHSQVQISTPSAWSSGTQYAQGALVSYGGVNYYAVNSSLGVTPPNTLYWYALTGMVYEIPSPYTSAMLFNSDGTAGIQIEQSADVLYIACGSCWPMTLSRYGTTNWQFAAYAPPDGPFLTENSSASPALYVVPTSGQPGVYDCYATSGVFDELDVANPDGLPATPGRLVRIDAQQFNIKTWQEQDTVSIGDLRRWNGNTYVSLKASTGTGPNPPVQTSGVQWDGGPGCGQWLYQDSGYGIGEVTTYISATHVQVTASYYAGSSGNLNANQQYLFPKFVQGTTASVTGITQANPAVVTISGAAAPTVGDPVYLTSIGGMTQISERMFTVTAISGSSVTLGECDSSGYSAFTSGGTLILNASLNWSIGAWGSSLARTAGSYPTTVCFFEDRLFWGGGIRWWGSAPGAYTSHAQDLYSQVTADCAVDGILAAQDVDAIGWFSPAILLLIGTGGGEFALGPLSSTEALGPGNTDVERQSKFRSKAIRPEIIGTSNYYVQASGKKVMAQDYNFYLNRYDSTNQNRLANHIAGYTVSSAIVDIAYHAEPYETLWCLRSDGLLVGFTVDRQDDVTAWEEEPMAPSQAGGAVVESICVIPAPDETRDELWLSVNRSINGQTVRTVEYLEKDFETGDTQSSACYVDCSLKYNGSPASTVTGLDYLDGETVQVLADGGYAGSFTVASGSITLPYAASVVQVGLYAPNGLMTMDVEGGADVGTAQGKVKRPSSVVVRVKNTLGGMIGVATASTPWNPPSTQASELLPSYPTTTTLGQAPTLFTGDVDRVGLQGDPIPNCKLQIWQPLPYPMEILGIFPVINVNEPSAA